MSARTPAYIIDPWQSKTDAVLARRGRRLGSPAIWTLLAMLAVLSGIAPFIRIDRIVTSSGGQIVTTAALNTFQALDPSIIKSIDVREGEQVATGQLLATLDPTFATADVEGLRRQMVSLDAMIDRIKAEQSGKPYSAGTDKPNVYGLFRQLQEGLYLTRTAQLRAQVQSFDEKIAAAQASIVHISTDQEHLAEREKIASQIRAMRDTLYKSGSTSLINLLQAEDADIELLRSVENNKNSQLELQHQIKGLQSDRQATIQQWYTASAQDLVAAENQRDSARAALEKALKHQDLVRLLAPRSSVVLTLTKLSAGSVLKEGDPVMTLIPVDAPIQAEIKFSAKDIGFVRPGNDVSIKVDAFNYVEHGTAEGRLEWISPDTFTTDDVGKPVEPFYKARVTIDKAAFINVPSGFRLIPGMTLEADINTGKRSLAAYVLGTVFHGLGEALREP